MCARHPHAGRRPNPATNKWGPTNQRQVAPTARRSVLKARCKRHTGEDAMTQDHPKVFGEKFGKGLSLLKGSRTQKKYKQQSRGGRLEHTKTLAHDGQTCSQPYILFIGQKRARGSSLRMGRFGDFYSEPKSVKSPKSA